MVRNFYSDDRLFSEKAQSALHPYFFRRLFHRRQCLRRKHETRPLPKSVTKPYVFGHQSGISLQGITKPAAAGRLHPHEISLLQSKAGNITWD